MAMNPRLLRPTPTGFDPRRIAGLVGWWDFSDAATLGPTSAGTGTVSNNGPIKYVADKSASGVAMIQSGADSIAPTYLAAELNNRSAAGFDGGDSMFCDFTKTFTSETVFAVARLTSAASGSARLFSQSDASNDFSATGHYIPLLRNGSTAAIAAYAAGGVRASVSVSYDTWLVACSRHTGSQIQTRINNGSAATYNHTLNLGVTRFAIGRSLTAFGDQWRDRVAELLVFDRSLSDSEMNTVARWLGKKWNITVS